MARKKKIKRFRAVNAVKELARERVARLLQEDCGREKEEAGKAQAYSLANAGEVRVALNAT